MDKKNHNEVMLHSITPKDPKTTWVALDNKSVIIAEGNTPVSVSEQAKHKTEDFSIMFIPSIGHTYIY